MDTTYSANLQMGLALAAIPVTALAYAAGSVGHAAAALTLVLGAIFFKKMA